MRQWIWARLTRKHPWMQKNVGHHLGFQFFQGGNRERLRRGWGKREKYGDLAVRCWGKEDK